MGWEKIANDSECITKRMSVPEGWIVMISGKWNNSVSITYVPDAMHEWIAPTTA